MGWVVRFPQHTWQVLSSVQRLVEQSRFVNLKRRDDEATKRPIKVGNALAFGTTLWSTPKDGANDDIPIDRRGCMQTPAA